MFRDYAHWDKFRQSDLFKELADGYREASGNHVIALTYYGERLSRRTRRSRSRRTWPA
jgi:TRAP-type C4-dicarboxylate transport system substrate-binding protein